MAQKQMHRKGKRRTSQAQIAKKWKGKDWFDVVSPQDFGGKVLYQTPSTDPKGIIGRNVKVPVSEITGDRSKYYMLLNLKVSSVKGTTANTVPNGFECMDEYLSRFVRKRKDKIEITQIAKTKDGWKIRLKPVIVTTRNVSSNIKTSIRNEINEIIDANAKKLSLNELTKEVISGAMQMKLKKQLSKIYPIRFAEIGRIKVLEASKNIDFSETNPETEENAEAKLQE